MIFRVARRARLAARLLGAYSSSRITCSTRWVVSSEIPGRRLRIFETVVTETPARAATSLMVIDIHYTSS